MAVIDFTVERQNKKTLKIIWDTAVDSDPKWVFVDGQFLSNTPTDDATSGNSFVEGNVANSRTAAIEVQSATEQPKSTKEIPNYLPVINWKSSAEAYRYLIYIDNTLIRTLIADNTKYLNKWQTVTKLTDGWHYLLVQAKDKAGNTQDSVTKWFRVYTPGDPVTDITVTNGSGLDLYDITIGV